MISKPVILEAIRASGVTVDSVIQSIDRTSSPPPPSRQTFYATLGGGVIREWWVRGLAESLSVPEQGILDLANGRVPRDEACLAIHEASVALESMRDILSRNDR